MVEEAGRGPVAVGRLMQQLAEMFGEHPAHQVPSSTRSRAEGGRAEGYRGMFLGSGEVLDALICSLHHVCNHHGRAPAISLPSELAVLILPLAVLALLVILVKLSCSTVPEA